jgi:hypothetical protein
MQEERIDDEPKDHGDIDQFIEPVTAARFSIGIDLLLILIGTTALIIRSIP